MRFQFTDRAKADLRAIDRATALRLLEALHRMGTTGTGDVKPLRGIWRGFLRYRVGSYRMIFRWIGPDIEVAAVDERSDIYRA